MDDEKVDIERLNLERYKILLKVFVRIHCFIIYTNYVESKKLSNKNKAKKKVKKSSDEGGKEGEEGEEDKKQSYQNEQLTSRFLDWLNQRTNET